MDATKVHEDYARDAPHLVQSFEEIASSDVHAPVAVEPTDYLRASGMELHPSPRISWLSDTLPPVHPSNRSRGVTLTRLTFSLSDAAGRQLQLRS